MIGSQFSQFAWHHYDRYLCHFHAKEICREFGRDRERFSSTWEAPKCLFIPLARCFVCKPLSENELRNRYPEMFGED